MPGYGPWNPDVGGPNSGKAERIEGAIPMVGAEGLGYGPFPQLVAANGAEALSAEPRGIISVQLTDGSWSVYVATSTTIEELQSDFTFDDIETGRTVTAGDDVSFVLFGKYLINTDTTSGMKAYDIIAGGTNAAISGAPAARVVFMCNNVLFALGTATNPRRFQSSDIGNHAKWAGGAADGKSLEDGGALTGGADLKNGMAVMFQEHAIRAVQFGAGASTYAVSKIADGLGCVAQRTVIPWDGRVAWWADDGPWMLAAGSAPVSIGAEKINRWAAESIGRQNFGNLQGTVDPERKLFLWRIDESRVLAFNWLVSEFTILPASSTALARIATPSISIDNLSGTIDALPGSIDNLGGSAAPILGGLNLSRKYATFTGQHMAATLETCLFGNAMSGLINWATPIDDCATGSLQVGVVDRMDGVLAWKSGASKVSGGRVPLRARGLNMAFRRNIPAGATWSYANGVKDIVAATGGPR